MEGQHKRGSLVWGVVFTAAGIILLARHMGADISFWKLAAKSWPMLLVLAGLGKIFDYLRAGGGIGLRFRDVGLVFVILLFGGFAHVMARVNLNPMSWRIPIHWGKDRVFLQDIFRNSYTYEEEKTVDLPPGSLLSVENSYGSVEIVAGAVEEAKVRLKKVVYEDSEARAKAIAERLRLVSESDGPEVQVKTNWSELKGTTARLKTNLHITVPRQTRCKVKNRYGEIKMNGLEGDQEVDGSGGDLHISDIRGAVKIDNRNAATFVTAVTGNLEAVCNNSRLVVERVGGNVDIKNSFASSEITNVEGKVTIHDKESSVRVERVHQPVVIEAPQSSVTVRDAKADVKINAVYNRPIRVEDVSANISIACSNGQVIARNIKGTLTIQSTYGDLRVNDIQGPLTINAESSSVQAEDIKGTASIQTTLKEVLVNAVAGQATIRNKHGAITLAAGAKLQNNLDIINQNGKIDLVLPEESNFKIVALAKSGGVESQFEGPKLILSKDAGESLKGHYGTGGPTILLETSHETISIRKGTEIPIRSLQGSDRPADPARGKRGKRVRAKRQNDIRVTHFLFGR